MILLSAEPPLRDASAEHESASINTRPEAEIMMSPAAGGLILRSIDDDVNANVESASLRMSYRSRRLFGIISCRLDFTGDISADIIFLPLALSADDTGHAEYRLILAASCDTA